MSMIETMLATGESREIHLLHGVSHARDLAWREWLRDRSRQRIPPVRGHGFRPKESGGRPDGTGGGRRGGRWTARPDRRDTTITSAATRHDHCGGEIGAERGFPAEQIRKELYWPGPPARGQAPRRIRVTIGSPDRHLLRAPDRPSLAVRGHRRNALVRYHRLTGMCASWPDGRLSANVGRLAAERGTEPAPLDDGPPAGRPA
jgi:hypothetical protein